MRLVDDLHPRSLLAMFTHKYPSTECATTAGAEELHCRNNLTFPRSSRSWCALIVPDGAAILCHWKVCTSGHVVAQANNTARSRRSHDPNPRHYRMVALEWFTSIATPDAYMRHGSVSHPLVGNFEILSLLKMPCVSGSGKACVNAGPTSKPSDNNHKDLPVGRLTLHLGNSITMYGELATRLVEPMASCSEALQLGSQGRSNASGPVGRLWVASIIVIKARDHCFWRPPTGHHR
jgi:hypothetical protein